MRADNVTGYHIHEHMHDQRRGDRELGMCLWLCSPRIQIPDTGFGFHVLPIRSHISITLSKGDDHDTSIHDLQKCTIAIKNPNAQKTALTQQSSHERQPNKR